MNITLNGEQRGIDMPCNIDQLIAELELTGKRLAIELNREIVPRSRYAETTINDGDSIEIVHAIGGG